MQLKSLLTSREAAEYIGYSEYSLRASRMGRTLGGHEPPEHIKIGRTVRYRLSDLDSWIQEVSHHG